MESHMQRPTLPATVPSYLAAARRLQGAGAGRCAVPGTSPAHGPPLRTSFPEREPAPSARAGPG